jgi:hypothetical protein
LSFISASKTIEDGDVGSCLDQELHALEMSVQGCPMEWRVAGIVYGVDELRGWFGRARREDKFDYVYHQDQL